MAKSPKTKSAPLASAKPAVKSAPAKTKPAPTPTPASTPTKANGKPAPTPGHARYAQCLLTETSVLRALVTVNPRREPTRPGGNIGYHAMAALIAAGKDGMTWAEYKEVGGRTEDIRWDVARGWASVTNK